MSRVCASNIEDSTICHQSVNLNINDSAANDEHLKLIEALISCTESDNQQIIVDINKQLATLHLDSDSLHQALHLTNIAISNAHTQTDTNTYINLLLLKSKVFAQLQMFEQAYTTISIAFEKRQLNDDSANPITQKPLNAEINLANEVDENRLLALENASVNAQLKNKHHQSYVLYLAILFLLSISTAAIFMYIQSKRAEQRFAELANTDELTQLANRRTAFSMLTLQQKIAKREKFNLSLALVDLDNFKQINDKFGHPAGDQILQNFANMAKGMFRQSDLIARIGGEEFLFIFPYTSVDKAQELMNEFTEKLRFDESVKEIISRPLTCSIGIVDAAQSESEHEAIKRADKAMYNAKSVGRDAIVVD